MSAQPQTLPVMHHNKTRRSTSEMGQYLPKPDVCVSSVHHNNGLISDVAASRFRATFGHTRYLVVRLDYVFEPTHVLCADCPKSVCSDERRCLLPKPMSARRSGRPLPPFRQIRRWRMHL